jgi:hypothetical protein
VTKEKTNFNVSLNSSWIIYNSTAAEFKKVLSYMVQDTDTDKINYYYDDIRKVLVSWNNAEKGNNKTVTAKLKALESVTGKKAEKTDFTKAAETLLKNAKKECTNENTHTAFANDDYICVTDSYVAIRTENHNLYNGYVSENGLNMAQLFTLKSNDICKVYLPDIVTVKKNTTKGKKETYFITEDKTAYNANYLYNAMLACSYDTNSQYCNAYKIENNNKSIIFIENTYTQVNAIVIPVFIRNENDKNIIANNVNSFIAYDNDKNIIGVTCLTPNKYPEDVTKVMEDQKKQEVQEVQEEKHNNVIEYIKKHFVQPVTIEQFNNDYNFQQIKHITSDTDLLNAFIRVYHTEYNHLYNNPSYEQVNKKYMYAAESFMNVYPAMHIKVCNTMKDLMVSDRELIAYGLTLKMYSFDINKYIPDNMKEQEDTNIYKIANVELSGKECREYINNKKYIVYKHCVYKVQEDTKKGYTAKRIYKSNDVMPLVNPGMYKALDRESVQRLINQSIKQYYA